MEDGDEKSAQEEGELQGGLGEQFAGPRDFGKEDGGFFDPATEVHKSGFHPTAEHGRGGLPVSANISRKGDKLCHGYILKNSWAVPLVCGDSVQGPDGSCGFACTWSRWRPSEPSEPGGVQILPNPRLLPILARAFLTF